MDILEFFVALREGFPFLFEYVANSIVMAFIALAIVYMAGRMLNIIGSDIPKNILALLVMGGVGWFMAFMKYEFSRPKGTDIWFFIWDITLYIAGAIIFYVLFCFNLYNRIDSLLDRKVGDDRAKTKRRKK